MGLPLLTLPGRSFAARFCASVVSAAGLPELICATPQDYVQRAIELGRDRAKVAHYRQLLQGRREASVLRDIPALVRRLEGIFLEMQADAEKGRLPVPDLTNLDIYYDIGVELDLENIDGLDDLAYVQLYVEKLSQWDQHARITPDQRFWSRPDQDNSSRMVALGR